VLLEGNTDDILREALTGGAQRAFEAELSALASAASADPAAAPVPASGGAMVGARPLLGATTAAEVRAELLSVMGEDAFRRAHGRLEVAARGEGADDDALANGEVQGLLGDDFRNLLPRMLKLIYLEERARALAPW
jgi:hypothetical protein